MNNKSLLDEFEKLEDSFYNIDSGLIQHPEIVQFSRTLEHFKQLLIYSENKNINNMSSIGNEFIDKLQLQELKYK